MELDIFGLPRTEKAFTSKWSAIIDVFSCSLGQTPGTSGGVILNWSVNK